MTYSPRHFHLIGATSGEIRTAKYQGREHVVVPVVALMEGVIFPVNADTPELVLAQQFSIAPQGWNGRPIFPNHPVENGTQISGNSPKVLESQAIGTIFNARVRNKRLLMDAYIDTNQSSELGKKVLARARRGEMIEVSVGAFVRTSAEKGSFNGKAYKGVWQDIVPDHLAMLPEGTLGACSIAMGCGSHRAAQAAPLHLVTAEGMEQVEDNDSRLTDAAFAHHNFIREQIQKQEESKGGGDWDESKHPREEDGKWTDGPGSGDSSSDSEKSKEDKPEKEGGWRSWFKGKSPEEKEKAKKAEFERYKADRKDVYDKAHAFRFKHPSRPLPDDIADDIRRIEKYERKKGYRKNMSEHELIDAVGNGNNQYRQDNPTKDEHASGDRTRVDKVFAKTAKSILGAGAKDNFEGGMTWSKDRGYADAKYRSVIEKAEAKGYKKVEVSPTGNPDGSYMGWDKVYRHKNGSEVRISSSYGPTKDYNSHHITITPPKLRTAEAMHDKEDEEALEPDPEEMDLTEEEQKKRYEMTQAERKTAMKQKYRYAAEYYDCEECGGTGQINGKDCPHCKGTGKMKVAAGRRHSQDDVNMIQEMHDRSVMLGAACGQERALEHRFAQANSHLFDAFKAAIGSTDPELRTAGCGCGGRSSATDDAHSQGDTDMASKQERIAALISSPKTPFTAADSKMLEAASDERLTALEAHVASLVTAEKKATDTDTALKAASDNITALQTQVTELKAASEKKQTPEEFLASNPDLKALVDNAKAQEAAHIAALVTSLKTAQSEYTEDELKAMSLNDLRRLANVAKAQVVQPVVDFSARSPRAAENKTDDAIPAPPSLNAAIRAAAGKQ